VANSLMTLQTLYGTIPKIYTKGTMSKRVLDMMMRKKREAADSENQVSPQIDTLLLIDRNVDLLTPLFTQLTYEGLIDELYGIHHSKCLMKKNGLSERTLYRYQSRSYM